MNARAADAGRPRAPRWRRRALLGTVIALAAVALLLAWLLGSGGGRDAVLARVAGLLPPGSLQWSSAEGTVRGPLVLHDLHYHHDGVDFRARRVLLDVALLPALGRRLQLDALEVEQAGLQLPAADETPFELPAWPEVLPRFDLPLAIDSREATITGLRIQRGDAPVIAISRLEASGLVLAHGGFTLSALRLDSDRGTLSLKGDYLPGQDHLTRLSASLALAPVHDEAARLQLSATGDAGAMQLDVSGTAPEPLSLSLRLTGAAAPDWTLRAQSSGLQPALFGADATQPLRFDLQAQGQGSRATVQGELAQGERRVGIAPSQLAFSEGRMEASPLRLDLDAGQVRVTGHAALGEDPLAFDLRLASDALHWAPDSNEAGALPVDGRGELRAQGTLDAWRMDGEASLVRGGREARLVLEGDGDRTQLQLTRLQATAPSGRLEGEGRIAWQPAFAFDLRAQLAGFDPGYFLPDYPGALTGRLAAKGEQAEDGTWRGQAALVGLGGHLRGRPVSGQGQVGWNGRRGDLDLAIGLGESHVAARGGFGDRLDLVVRLAPLSLADLLPEGAGRLQGEASVRGTGDAPDVTASLSGTDLHWEDLAADALRLDGHLPARGDGGAFTLRGEGLVLGVAMDRLAVDGRGSLAALALDAQAESRDGRLDLSGTLSRRGNGWHGSLASLRLAPLQGPALVLQDAAGFDIGAAGLRIERSCLAAEGVGGRLCVAATGREASLDGEDLPLSVVQPWLQVDPSAQLAVDGSLDLRARLHRGAGGRWVGDARLESAQGHLRLDEAAERELFGYRDLGLDLALSADVVTGQLEAQLADGGRVSAQLHTGREAGTDMDGVLDFDVRDLTWMELFSEDLAMPTGRLHGRIALAGQRGAPALSGDARLEDFAGELPALGVKLREGDFQLTGQPDGVARLQGSVRSGEGRMRLDGSLNFRDREAPLQLTLAGDRVVLASTAELYVVANTDLALRYLEGRMEVRGSLDVPEARIDLELLDSDLAVSPDVVVVDPMDGERQRALPLDLDFRVSLGEQVALKGFGLDGRLGGQLALRQRPGRGATATGALDVSGQYRAYGQALSIERARLGFNNSPYDDPTLDIRANRDFEEVTVGVQVRGTARRPETSVVSSPAMETNEALAWLLFGRPLQTTSGSENEQLGAAALALGAGGNLIAQQLGAQLGFDEAGVVDSRNLGGAAFTVGKYVSPRLFVSYGVSLIGAGEVVTLKYLLKKGFDIRVESGLENAASLNWRTEK